MNCQVKFLSTLSLRRATGLFMLYNTTVLIFLSTLSLRRATLRVLDGSKSSIISIHALLAESDALGLLGWLRVLISIHALLAESDIRYRISARYTSISIHALLAESDLGAGKSCYVRGISIHALLAESDYILCVVGGQIGGFLSTLSLRRATSTPTTVLTLICISIHALLAESDICTSMHISSNFEFLSTLSLRRATKIPNQREIDQKNFYPRSPCGERPRHEKRKYPEQ